MHKTFKNQTRYKFDKIPNKPRRHSQEWQARELSKLYQEPKSTHDWGNQNKKIPKEKWYQRINQTLYTFHDGTQSTKTKNVCLPNRHDIGIKYQLKTTNVHKHIG